MRAIPTRRIRALLDIAFDAIKRAPAGSTFESGCELEWWIDKDGNVQTSIDLEADVPAATGTMDLGAGVQRTADREYEKLGQGCFYFKIQGNKPA